MATFISKEEILGAAKEVPALMGANPQPFSGGGSESLFGGGNSIDKLERILSQINGILTQVNSIRSNPTTQALIGSKGSTAQPNFNPQLVASAAPQQIQTLQPAIKPEIKPPEINEEGVKEFIAAVMEELDKNEGAKGITLGAAVQAYKLGIQKGQLEENAISKFKEWLPKLIK